MRHHQTTLPSLIRWIGFWGFVVHVHSSCQPPDVPFGGYYVPVQTRYPAGEKVSYECKDKFTQIGSRTRMCQATGKWSEPTPFCDTATKVKNPRASPSPRQSASFAVDNSPNTCYISQNRATEWIQVHLDEPAVVNVVRLYLSRGTIKIDVFVKTKKIMKICATFDRDIEENQWVMLECDQSYKEPAESVHIQDSSDKANVLTVCEIQVFVKDSVWCKNPPRVFIPNGYLEVSRDKATLRCADGYKEKAEEDNRLLCDKNGEWTGPNLQCKEILCENTVGDGSLSGGKWHLVGKVSKNSIGTKKNLQCDTGYSMAGSPKEITCLKNGTWTKTTATCKRQAEEKISTLKIVVIAVATIVVILIFLCLGLTLYCVQKKRSKEVVVVFKQGDCDYVTQSLGSAGTTTCSEYEYSSVVYDGIQDNPPPTPAKPPLILPGLTGGYSKPIDNRRLPANMLLSNNQQTLLLDQQTLPADIAFGTLKQSTLYGH